MRHVEHLRRTPPSSSRARLLSPALAILVWASLLLAPGCDSEDGSSLPEGVYLERPTPTASTGESFSIPDEGELEKVSEARAADSLRDIIASDGSGGDSPTLATSSSSGALSGAPSDPGPRIEELAEELGHDPLRIFEFVRNEIEFEPYFGSVKGATETLLQEGGNDYDIAALLMALLRASDVEATFARGFTRVSLDDAASWVGVEDIDSAITLWVNSGLPLVGLVDDSGTLVGLAIEHVWVELPGLRTQTQGGWGAPPRGTNPGAILQANFDELFPDGVVIGDLFDGSDDGGASVRYSSASTVEVQLPAGGPPRRLAFSGDREGPVGSPHDRNVLLGQTLAATINLAFSDATRVETLGTPDFASRLGEFVPDLGSSPLDGRAVREIVELGNDVLGGSPTPAGVSVQEVADALAAVNEIFVDGGDFRLDASFKRHRIRPGRNPYEEAGLEPTGLIDAVLENSFAVDAAKGTFNEVDTDAIERVLQDRKEQVLAYLEENAPTLTTRDLIGGQTIIPDFVASLPTSVSPLRILGGTTRFDRIPEADRKKVHLTGFGFDATLETHRIAGKRVTVGFEPATSRDEQIIASFGDLLDTPPLAADLRPIVRIDGETIIEGDAAPLGTFTELFVSFSARGTLLAQLSHFISTGGHYAVALDTQRVPLDHLRQSRDRIRAALDAGGDVLRDGLTGEVLHALGMAWYESWRTFAEYAVGTSGGRLVKQQINEALVGQDLTVRFEDGIPRMSMGDLFIDAQRGSFTPVSRVDDESFPVQAFLITVTGAASKWEEGIFRKYLGWPGNSTPTSLRQAAFHEIPLFTIDGSNVDELLPRLTLPPSVVNLIENEVEAGRTVLVHRDPVPLGKDRGKGFLVVGDSSASYLISRSRGGGETVVAPRAEQTSEEQRETTSGVYRFFEGALTGLIEGDFDRGMLDCAAFLAGKTLGQIVSGALVFGDVRDAVAAVIEIVETGGESGFLNLGLSLVGLVPVVGDYIKSARHADEVVDVIAGLSRNEALTDQQVLNLFRETAEAQADDALVDIARNADEAAGIGEIRAGRLLDELTANAEDVRVSGLDVEVRNVDDGRGLIQSMGLDPTDVSNANKGRIGENVSDAIGDANGWQRLDVKTDATSPGIDRVFRDPDSGEIIVVESKFTSGQRNIGRSQMATRVNTDEGTVRIMEQSELWLRGSDDLGIQGAIERSVEVGSFSDDVADQIRGAIRTGNLRREIHIVRDNDVGNTITSTMGRNLDFRFEGQSDIRARQVNLGGVLGE